MTSGLVLDLVHAGTAPMLAAMRTAKLLRSRDAIGVIQLAHATRYRYVICAGQLHKPTAGAFAALTNHPNIIDGAMLAAHERMGEAGARYTTWVISADDAVKDRLTALLAEHAPVEGSA